jgi:hypothetical protein
MRPRLRSIAICVALSCALAAPSAALASHGQVAILQDDNNLLSNPGPTLQEMRHIGVQMVRMSVRWSLIAPSPNSRTRPAFNASNPNAYPSGSWAPYDTTVREAKTRGLTMMFVPTGFAPLWAQGSNPGPYGASYNSEFAWKPSASAFGQFVRALATRYSGHFRPPGPGQSVLPRVSNWELWNEPNFGEDLAPQAINGSRVLDSPRMYRDLAGASWNALHATGHGHDRILIGSLAARGAQIVGANRPGAGLPGTYGMTKPLAFMRELYCLNSSYQQYLGAAAAVRGCPTTRAGYGRFRAHNPALFNASGVSDHPYPSNTPPNRADSGDPSYAEFNQLPHFAQALDRMQRIYGSGKRFPIWNTEYGYITCQPTCTHVPRYVSPATAAYYTNWAEYLSWRNPRLASTMQYLLYDPNPTVGTPEYGGFASGLIFYRSVLGGQPKPNYNAYRLPIFLPRTSTKRGRQLEVWGGARPAPLAAADTHQPQYVQIEFAPGSSNSWTTLKTLRVTDRRGYFDAHVAFPSSGSVRIAWTYPATDALLASTLVTGYVEPLGATNSRSVKVNIG